MAAYDPNTGLSRLMSSGYLPSDNDRYKELLSDWNRGEIGVGYGIDRGEAEQLAATSYVRGDHFNVESNPWKKGAFSFFDAATFGLLPDKYFKPEQSIGEMYHGQSTADQWATGIGTVGGAIGSGYGLLKGASALGRRGTAAWNEWRAAKNAKEVYGASLQGGQLAQIGTSSSRGQLALGRGTPLGLPGPGVGRPGQIAGNQGNLLQLTAGNRMSGPGMTRMLDNMRTGGYYI